MADIEVADVFRQFGPSYVEAFGDRMPASHLRAIDDIVACRTRAMGGHLYQCGVCGKRFHVYHGCRNRSCPACHTHQAAQWLEARKAEMLPCPYYHVVVTVPKELRALFRANQKDAYGLLIKASAEAVLELCRDKRYMGATPAILAVLHTWTARMDYHPHVHLLVSGGAIAKNGTAWREAKHRFLIPVRALSRLVRGKLKALLAHKRPDLRAQFPRDVGRKEWVAWCGYWGEGEHAVLDYLARYVHRIAITNARIVAMDEATVTFRYKERKRAKWRSCTLAGHEFMRRFLQHVLPKGLHKIRYYGLWNPKRRKEQRDASVFLEVARGGGATAPSARQQDQPPENQASPTDPSSQAGPICPHCGSTRTHHLAEMPRITGHHAARASPRVSPRASPDAA